MEQIIVPLKYLSLLWKTIETSLINCEINLILDWCKECVISYNALCLNNNICNNQYKSLCSSYNVIN